MQAMETRRWRFKGPEMEGPIARWYARVRGSQSQLEAYRKQGSQLTSSLPDGAAVLEVAPGPGYLAIEMARPGRLQITALDISRTFVQIARENARQAGVNVDVRQGDAAGADHEFTIWRASAAGGSLRLLADVAHRQRVDLRRGE